MHLAGTPSDDVPAILATGSTDADFVFLSLSAREPQGRDAEYIEWHTLDHRPEQYRLSGLRNAVRLVSTPACRAARAASREAFDRVDHVMTYQFAGTGSMPGFGDLGAALHDVGRMPLRLPSLGYLTARLASKVAAPRAVAGADVIPWRPALGVYLLIEQGHLPADDLVSAPGVAGVWTYHGEKAPEPYPGDATGQQITCCFLDADPVASAAELGLRARARWATGQVSGLLAAPFHTIVPFDWTRHLPC
ncbi:MAG: hypothetical protein KGN34_03560 [Sphingomonadales bacterium]|nr:hypothetical protein [Sphingomonadales bacterium]